jgi:hypothetical protein
VNKPNNSLLSISNAVAIDRYFHYNLLNSNLSEKEFSKYRQKSESEFKNKIKEWINNGLSQEVFNRLKRIELFNSKDDYEKIIYTIFFYASLPNENDKNRVLGFDKENLLSKLSYKEVKMFYNTKDEFETFVETLFKTQKPPYLFVSNLMNHIFQSNSFNWEFVLSEKKLIDQKLSYFKQYAEGITTLDVHFFWLYNYCTHNKWVKTGDNSGTYEKHAPKEAKCIFKECAKRIIDDFLKNIVSRNPRFYDDEEQLYSILPVIKDIWEGWDNFENFLLEFDERQVKSLKEFKDFFNKCKEINFQQYIKYDFETIDLTDALLFSS